MLNQDQFDQLLSFSRKFLTGDEEAKALAEKSGLTSTQLEVIAVLIAYSIRAYDDLKDGAVLGLR